MKPRGLRTHGAPLAASLTRDFV